MLLLMMMLLLMPPLLRAPFRCAAWPAPSTGGGSGGRWDAEHGKKLPVARRWRWQRAEGTQPPHRRPLGGRQGGGDGLRCPRLVAWRWGGGEGEEGQAEGAHDEKSDRIHVQHGGERPRRPEPRRWLDAEEIKHGCASRRSEERYVPGVFLAPPLPSPRPAAVSLRFNKSREHRTQNFTR